MLQTTLPFQFNGMQVVILGSGNVAHVLGAKLKAAGNFIQQVYSRNLHQASLLADKLYCQPIDDLAKLTSYADLYLLAVSDTAIPVVAAAMPTVSGLVVHTAGSVSMQVLESAAQRYGVLYPLQSLRIEKTDYGDIPFLVNGNTPECGAAIEEIAQTLSSQVVQADDEHRLKLHMTAVVVSSFTNHLYALAEEFCWKENTDFRLLQPLIEETATRMRQYAPAQMQTGPAVRGDEATIYQHLQLLEHYPQLQQVYQQLTQSIQLMNN